MAECISPTSERCDTSVACGEACAVSTEVFTLKHCERDQKPAAKRGWRVLRHWYNSWHEDETTKGKLGWTSQEVMRPCLMPIRATRTCVCKQLALLDIPARKQLSSTL